jgi:hypothetical protein
VHRGCRWVPKVSSTSSIDSSWPFSRPGTARAKPWRRASAWKLLQGI